MRMSEFSVLIPYIPMSQPCIYKVWSHDFAVCWDKYKAAYNYHKQKIIIITIIQNIITIYLLSMSKCHILGDKLIIHNVNTIRLKWFEALLIIFEYMIWCVFSFGVYMIRNALKHGKYILHFPLHYE